MSLMFKHASAPAKSGNKIRKSNVKNFFKQSSLNFDLTGEFCQAEKQRVGLITSSNPRLFTKHNAKTNSSTSPLSTPTPCVKKKPVKINKKRTAYVIIRTLKKKLSLFFLNEFSFHQCSID